MRDITTAELKAENEHIRQNSVSHTTHQEFVNDYKIAELNDFQNSQCAKLLVRNGELERELADEKTKSQSLRTAANSLKMHYEQSQRELAAAKEDLDGERYDFADYVTSGIQNPAPYCRNACEKCVDARGWCIIEKCKGFSRSAREGEGK